MLFGLVFLFGIHSQAAGQGCLFRHLEDALKINQARRGVYGAVNGGVSFVVSDSLIQFERDLLPMAKWADLVAVPLQHQGVPVLCNDLKDMKLAPSLNAHLPTSSWPNELNFVFLNITQMQLELSEALDSGFPAVEKRGLFFLGKLEGEPRLNCLLRHFLESIVLFARNAPAYQKKLSKNPFLAVELKWMMHRLIQSHIKFLVKSDVIDRLALPVQTQGIPILCDDVPRLL